MFDETVLVMGLCLAALYVGIHLVFKLADAAREDGE